MSNVYKQDEFYSKEKYLISRNSLQTKILVASLLCLTNNIAIFLCCKSTRSFNSKYLTYGLTATNVHYTTHQTHLFNNSSNWPCSNIHLNIPNQIDFALREYYKIIICMKHFVRTTNSPYFRVLILFELPTWMSHTARIKVVSELSTWMSGHYLVFSTSLLKILVVLYLFGKYFGIILNIH